MSIIKNNIHYENCIIEAPDGQALCRTGSNRIYWYEKRNLGKIVNDNPLTLRLFIEPKIKEKIINPYNICYKYNICVVCGYENNLTKHHVVPKCFRKHFKLKNKEHFMHDVLLLCRDCHNKYEIKSNELKKDISYEMNIPLDNGSKCPVNIAANALYYKYYNIPLIRRNELLKILEDYFGKDDITMEEIEFLVKNIKTQFRTFAKKVVENLDNIRDFQLRWRKHFVDSMNPRYLPDYWNIYL